MKRKSAIQLGLVLLLSALLVVSVFAGTVKAITNGQPDGKVHPYVVLVVFDDSPGNPAWRTTGILLSPTIVLTAGHGTDGAVAARVWVDEVVQGNPEYPYSGATSYDGIPITNPNFAYYVKPGLTGFITHDVGIVVLTEPVPTSVVGEYGSLPAVGLVNTLAVGAGVTFVGYGVQYQVTPRNNGGPYEAWRGVKDRFFAPAQLLSNNFALSNEFIKCSSNAAQGKGGTAFGDSGGPVFLGNTKTILALTSFGSNNNCAGIGYYYRIDQTEILNWIDSYLYP